MKGPQQMKIMKTAIPSTKRLIPAGWIGCSALAVLLLAGPGALLAQSDDFSSGNDLNWTHYAPLEAFGIHTVFGFPNGRYRIQTMQYTGDKGNPGRAGSIRQGPDYLYWDFYVAVDVVSWKDDTRQAFGVLGRVDNLGLGTTTGYAFTYERGSGVTPTSGALDISRLDGENPTSIQGPGSTSIHFDPEKTYRMVFVGKGSAFEGRIYGLPDTSTPLIVIRATDTTYPAGYSGLVIYDNSSGGTGLADATFDNYLAAAQEPPRLTIWPRPETQEVLVGWPVEATIFMLQGSTELPANWSDLGRGDDLGNGYRGVLDGAASGNKFYRLVVP
jgi:hypothetical protein